MTTYTQQLKFPLSPCYQDIFQESWHSGGAKKTGKKQKGGSCHQVPAGAHIVLPCWATQQSGNAAEHSWNNRFDQTGAGAKKTPKYRKERPSPSSSATEFKIGTRRKGNDGNFYKVVINKKGVKRWQKIKPTK